jgi:hypothetical protein
LLQAAILVDAAASFAKNKLGSIFACFLELVEHIFIPNDTGLLTIGEDPFLAGFESGDGVISLLGKVIESRMQVFNLLSCLQQLLFHILWQALMMVLDLCIIVFNTEISLSLVRFGLNVVQEPFGFSRKLRESVADLIKRLILLVHNG